MKNVKLVALRPMKYATRRLMAGDEFMATRQDARALSQIKRARYAPADSPPAVQQPQQQAVPQLVERPIGRPTAIEPEIVEPFDEQGEHFAEETSTSDQPDESRRARRQYRRRDLTAED